MNFLANNVHRLLRGGNHNFGVVLGWFTCRWFLFIGSESDSRGVFFRSLSAFYCVHID